MLLVLNVKRFSYLLDMNETTYGIHTAVTSEGMWRTLGNDDVFLGNGLWGCFILPLPVPVATRLPLPPLPKTPPAPPAHLLLLLRDSTLEKEHVRLLRPLTPLGGPVGCDPDDDADDASGDTGVGGSCWM